jgi:type II secretory pathway pseudopilin PulG
VRRRPHPADESGFTLIELLVAGVILIIIVGALADLFVAAQRSQQDLSGRAQAQTQSRVALDAMRRELRCASSISPTAGYPVSSITVQLGSYCPTNTSGSAGSFTWCTKANGSGYALWRYSGSSCSGSGSIRATSITTTSAVTAGKIFTTFTGGSPGVPRAPEPSLSVETAATGGSIVPGTYFYVVTYTIQTTAAPTTTVQTAGTEASVTVPAGSNNNKVDIICPPYPPPTGYQSLGCNIYGRSTTSGSDGLLANYTTVGGATVTTWVDSGSVTPSTTIFAPASSGPSVSVDLPVKVRGAKSIYELIDSLELRNMAR